MPVFTQTCTIDDDPATLSLATCTCGCLTSGDLMLIDSSSSAVASGSTSSLLRNSSDEHAVSAPMFIHIDGVLHWSTCALYTSALNGSTGGNKNSITRLKQQQQLQHPAVGGLALLRKPHTSALQPPKWHNPFEPVRLLPSRTAHLAAGSRFQGKQKSGSSSYDVMVDIKHVNLKESSLCGYLHIKGLTEEYPELTTFFDAEIIGSAHSFVTRKWDADVKVDKEHWTLFKPFEPMCDIFTQESFKYDFQDKDVIFMRWKEHFLVPDHRVEGITGASFAGFYYICYFKSTGEIDGYYYHRSSEKFQKLMLRHVQDRPTSHGSYEFR
ncbi:hypothetical protein BGZ75_009389 [Mortierella antarctica]|nr:hypothetical protein BGZ75_009389 [Mortierella antarctica]